MISLDDFEQTSHMPEKPLKEWRDRFDTNILTSSDVIDFFQKASPFFFSVGTPTEYNNLGRCSFNDQGAKAAILDVLEEFLLGDNPETVLDKIKAEQNVSTVCNRVFKSGEPFYSCRECGVDPTCVLCVNCFKQSAHRHHKYKIGTSMGNGCCDCGDSEAWKQDSSCDEHKGSEKSLQSTVITDRMRDRCRLLFDSVLCYCMASLKVESNASLRGLEGESGDDTFCTVLYNDETHTFEQVINALTRIVQCSQKDAIEYVSNIDREGRAVVKCATFSDCLKLKEEFEKHPPRSAHAQAKTSLKVAVLHKDAMANQQFSLILLSWFQDLLSKSPVFRHIFANVISQNTPYNLREILLNDCKLWKTARTAWHRVLLSGMLMEHENKKALAVAFTKQYSSIMQEYIGDDHEHSFSIVSLSVQLFTVPSIAQHLIANESAFFKLMQTFYSESIEQYVRKKTIQFTRQTNNMMIFKRAAYILFDLKYVLSFKPNEWTDELRMEFLHGVQLLIKLLKEMQGMDSVHRQTGQHMEYEPEWESAFNLHIKLAPIITLVIDWCSSDRVVFIKVYRMTIAALMESDYGATQVQELADHSAQCIMYDVSTKPVSIHLPLSRFFAGLYLLLEKYDLTFDTIITTKAMSKPAPEQIIDPVLCTQTMIAQVHAGMWRRNGYSLLNQLYFYRNVKCRSEMLDRDIVVLQIGASLIESNEFLIHLLSKFNLINWAAPDFETTTLLQPEEDSIRQVINMVDEMLELIIVVVGERYVPGIGTVTEEEKIKKEIIQSLCIKPYTHSELSRTLPDVQYDDNIEEIIDSVADFKKPLKSDKIGVYELKPQYYNDYNMFFYHYTKEEKSKSEEEQRKRRKAKNELLCCPPPNLPKLTPIFSMLANLLQCDVMLLIMQTVLKRAHDLKSKSFSDSHLQKVLYLIGYAVQEQRTGHYPFFQFYERAVKWNILQLLEELIGETRVDAHRDMILWTVRRYKELQPNSGDKQQAMESDDVSTSKEKSDDKSTADIEKMEKEDRAKLAAERRAKIMAQMASAQKNFMTSNAELFKSTATTTQDKNEAEDAMEWQDQENDRSFVCLGPNRKYRFVEDPVVTCILCSEDAVVGVNGPCMVYSAFVQKSNVLAHPNEVAPSPHSSTCGHVMHATCWKEYFNNEVAKENRRPNRNRSQNNFATEKKEFLCPLCRCLSNAVLPITPALSRLGSSVRPNQSEDSLTKLNEWLQSMQTYNEHLKKYADATEMTEDEIADMMKTDMIHPSVLEYASDRDIIADTIKEYVVSFSNSAQAAAPYANVDSAIEPLLVTWMSCAYTVEILEMYLRALNKPLKGQKSIRQTSCLSGLIHVSGLLVTTIDKDVAQKIIAHMRGQLNILFGNSKSSFVDWDLFKVLVQLVFMTPSVLAASKQQCILPNGTILESYLLQLVFNIMIAKITTLNKIQLPEEEMDVDDKPSDAESTSMNEEINSSHLVDFYFKHNIHVKDARDANQEIPGAKLSVSEMKKAIMNEIRSDSRVFLRSCCLLFRFLTDIELPDDLYENDGDSYEIMCTYLGICCDPEQYMNLDAIRGLMHSLADHNELEELRKKRDSLEKALVPCTPKIRRLVDLPTDYSDLINSVSTFTCPNNDRDESRNPTMCLICGAIMCSMTYCCQREYEGNTVGSCTFHAIECGAGVGIFLRIRECEILLVGMNKGSFIPPPYLDRYGETDQGLRRGNPLTLCADRYEKINLMWLNHTLHEDIARSAEIINNVIPTQWIHL